MLRIFIYPALSLGTFRFPVSIFFLVVRGVGLRGSHVALGPTKQKQSKLPKESGRSPVLEIQV